jgi:peptidoglycan/xylan/chitin deacetylase (PgdA/CDA1 family)
MTLRQFARTTIGLPVGLPSYDCAPVLTYHASYSHLPPFIAEVDNVTPERIYDQLATLKKHYRFVSIDEFCEAGARNGLAAVTFDDGYKSVIDEGLDAFSAHGIPLTVFVNLLAIEKRPFWRHKVVYVTQNRLTAECEASFNGIVRPRGLSFHQYTKHPANNSILVEQQIDRFLASRGLALPESGYLADDRRYFRRHPLLSFGNHTRSHYVLSSLSPDEQSQEIGRVKSYLAGLSGVNVSGVFSVPFGETVHVDENTYAALRDYGYRFLLLNRGGVNRGLAKRYGMRVVERFSVADAPIGWQVNRHYLETVTGRRGFFF